MWRVQLAAAVLLGLPVWAEYRPASPALASRATAARVSAQPPRAGGQLPPLPVAQIDPRQVTLDSARRLTLTFAEPRPIDEVLALLTAGTPFSVAIDADVTGMFRGELKQLTLRDALSTLLAPLGLDFQVQGTVIRVRRRTVETRVFDVDLLNVRRGLARASGSADASISSAAPPDAALDGIADGVRTLLSERGAVHVDKRAGLVQVTDFADRLDRVALYMDSLHQRSARQVRLQAQAFEVTLRQAASIDWPLVRERLGLGREATDAGLGADLAALRTALTAQGEVRTLWAPDVTALNNEPALLRMATVGGTSLTMTIVPQISADGIVQMSVSHAWEERAGDRKDGLFKSAPVIRVTEADTVMRVMDGHTAVIAGLLRPQEISVPSSGRLGAMFGSSSRQRVHAELVVLLRPTVVLP